MKDFWAYIQKVKDFLHENGIRGDDDIKLIKERIDQRIEKLQKVQQLLREGDEKWVQTLAIPVILAMISTVVNNSEDLTTMFSNCIVILIVFVLLITALSMAAFALRGLQKWEIANLELFSEDLQGVLDLARFSIGNLKSKKCK